MGNETGQGGYQKEAGFIQRQQSACSVSLGGKDSSVKNHVTNQSKIHMRCQSGGRCDAMRCGAMMQAECESDLMCVLGRTMKIEFERRGTDPASVERSWDSLQGGVRTCLPGWPGLPGTWHLAPGLQCPLVRPSAPNVGWQCGQCGQCGMHVHQATRRKPAVR